MTSRRPQHVEAWENPGKGAPEPTGTDKRYEEQMALRAAQKPKLEAFQKAGIEHRAGVGRGEARAAAITPAMRKAAIEAGKAEAEAERVKGLSPAERVAEMAAAYRAKKGGAK